MYHDIYIINYNIVAELRYYTTTLAVPMERALSETKPLRGRQGAATLSASVWLPAVMRLSGT